MTVYIVWRKVFDNYNSTLVSVDHVFTEMCTLWLVKNYIISCYNHPVWGDNNTEAIIFKMAVVWVPTFFFFKETRNTTLSNYTKEKVYIIILRLSGHFWIIPFTLSWRLLNNIHFTLCKYITVKYSKSLRYRV